MTVKKFYSWNEYSIDIADLKSRLNPDDYDVVVGIARGGLIPAVELSHYLNKPLVPLVWQTRDGVPPTALESYFTQHIIQKRILLVDDICDSGETFLQVYNAIYNGGIEVTKLTSVCLHYNCGEDLFQPDIWAKQLNKKEKPIWLCYPWENYE